ncbi:MAG: hypothetical protein LBD90_05825, partial [Bifidobacteriaceae bacterium]|nr:hypothetical protein [Bifidobacteriaceae bacterium]
DQLANHDAPGSSAASWGRQTITVTLRDAAGNPYGDAVGRLTASSQDAGVDFAAPAGQAGQFGCAAGDAKGPCPAGVYSLDVYAGLAGPKRVAVAYANPTGSSFALKEAGSGASFVTAGFVTPPADPAWSVFVLGDPVANPDETNPQDDWDDPSDKPDGGDSLTHDTGIAFHPNVRVWDAGRRNPVADVEVRLSLAPGCPAKFASTGADSMVARSSGEGRVSDAVNSTAAAQCVISAEIFAQGAWRPADGSPKVLTWADTAIEARASDFTVSAAPVQADGAATGTVTVNLMGVGGHPVTTAAGALAASGPAGGGLKVSSFTHSSATPGRYTATFTGLKAGDQEIQVAAAGAALPLAKDGNRFARMVAGPPAPSASWLVEPGGQATADGSASLAVKVRAFDATGNPATSGSAVFEIPAGAIATTAAGATAGPASVTVPVAGGLAQISLAAKLAGVHEVSASLSGGSVRQVKNAAEDTVVRSDGKAEAVFAPGPPDPAASVLTVPTAGPSGQTAKTVGGSEQHTAQVEVKDAQGNPVAAGSARVVFSWQYTDLSGAQVTGSSGSAPVGAQGVASYNFGSTVAATWAVSARVEGETADVSGSPASAPFVHGPLDRLVTLASFAADSGAKLADGIAHATAHMRAQDQYGNPIPGVSLGLLLAYSGNQGPLFDDAVSGSKAVTLTSGADGWVTADIYSIWPGDFEVRGVCDQVRSGADAVHFQGVPADPGTSYFNLKPAPGNSADPPIAAGQDAYQVTVGLLDAGRSPLNGAGAVVYFTPQAIPGASELRFPVTTGAAGRGLATVSLTTLKAGRWNVSVRIGSDQIATDEPTPRKVVPVVFAPGPLAVAPGTSSLAAPAAPAPADGQSVQRVDAAVVDANGNAIGGQDVV